MRGRSGGVSDRGEPADHPLVAGAVAFLVSAVFVIATAVAIPVRDVAGLVVGWGLVCFVVVVAVAKRFGPQYGVPLAIAMGVAFDAFYIPPFRPLGPDDWANWLTLALYVLLGVVLGGLAAGTRRRAAVSESARVELAHEQAALRRVATLVARDAPPPAVFAAVAEEVGWLFGPDTAEVVRYDGAGATSVGSWRKDGPPSAGGTTLGAPITVDGRAWGALRVSSVWEPRLPVDLESRLAHFTELAAMAIANAEAQAALTASRARIVMSTDETRRRIERDLHDGSQQRLVSIALRLNEVRAAVPPDAAGLRHELTDVLTDLNAALDELREFARGIHPAILADGGLAPALRSLRRRSPVPVELAVRLDGRLPKPIEVAAYFVVSEALTNAAKHAHASSVTVEVEAGPDRLRLRVVDDGTGGADLTAGSGLVGLKDRVEALGGRFDLRSVPGDGTSVTVGLPLHDTATRTYIRPS